MTAYTEELDFPVLPAQKYCHRLSLWRDTWELFMKQCQKTTGRKFCIVPWSFLSRKTVSINTNFILRCDICSKAFKDNEYMLRHMKIHEENTKSFVCQECGKFFKYKVTLRSHIRTMHDKIFKQTCEECGKSFADMHKLKVRKFIPIVDFYTLFIQCLGSGSKEQNINKKLQKNKILLTKPKSEQLNNRDYKNFLISEWYIKF